MTARTPKQIVAELDRYIVGQAAAKRAVAVALRNRYRRSLLAPELQAEVMPKNILMIGPTGVGKTEIARRLARLVGAPFIKVEATKYTEVGYVGRDVESMVRDLVEVAVRMVKSDKAEQVRPQAERAVEERILDALAPLPEKRTRMHNPLEALFGGGQAAETEPDQDARPQAEDLRTRRAEWARRLAAGELEQQTVEVEVEDAPALPMPELFMGPGMESMGQSFQELLGGLMPRRKRLRRLTVAQARPLLLQQEAQKLVDQEQAAAEGVERAENSGIIFIDEIDKIAGRGHAATGPDVSREGVQRDILPIVEGSTISTKYGPVRTDHILFIAAGAFHAVKPSDLIPELQGRFPIRVELEPLAEDDFVRILTEPQGALTKQYQALLAAENVELIFAPDGVREIAAVAARVNQETEEIGARRLHTVLEKLLEDVSFLAPDIAPARVVINAAYVHEKLDGVVAQRDVSRFIL